MKNPANKQKFCGNCDSHNVYEYPNRVFCGKRLAENQNPIVPTLWCCEKWNPASQECYCLRDATTNKNT
ncbi:MAG: hypothetical protein QW840_01095 [Candidatus Bathyarchaeia archaeon]